MMLHFKFSICILFTILFNPNIIVIGQHKSGASKFAPLKLLRDEIVTSSTAQISFFSEGVSKCGLGVVFDILQNWDALSEQQKRQFKILTLPPQTDTSRIIGSFQIHYDTSGVSEPAIIDQNGNPIPNTVEAYIDSVGKIFNHVWKYLIDTLRYAAPPFEPGQQYYNIYVQELYGSRIYGRTQITDQVNSTQPYLFTSYIEIDNDFKNYYSEGMDGLKVTAAHEFHHAIQLGSYGYWNIDYYFYEITSTWMEDVVYTEVNDYYQYLFNTPGPNRASQFSNPEIGFTLAQYGIEYSRAVWGKYVEKKFSPDVMLLTWESMKHTPSLPSLNSVLLRYGSTLREALIEYAIWNYQAGQNCDTVLYYTEGRRYPSMRLRPVVHYVSPAHAFRDSSQALGALYYPVMVSGTTMMVFIINLNMLYASPSAYYYFTYDMRDKSETGYRWLTNGLYVKLLVNDMQNWYVTETVPSMVEDIVVYPNPFYPLRTNFLKFRLPYAHSTSAKLDIFSASMQRIFSGEIPIAYLKPLEQGIKWDGCMNDGNKAPSGVYFFLLKESNREYRGKFSILND